jgi:hypothetical protein
LTQLRRAAAALGFTPASGVPEASEGRAVEAITRQSRLVEDRALTWHDVGVAERCPEAIAFLDGTQQTERVANDGVSGLFWARIGAAVLERHDRRLSCVLRRRRELLIGRQATLDQLSPEFLEAERLPLSASVPPHPVRDQLLSQRIVDQERGRLEIEVGRAWRQTSPGWLIVDGSLSQSPAWAGDPCMLGLVKSHSALPFEGDDLVRYLRLPAGHRTSVFAAEQNVVAPVYSWALRLWPWEGKDLLHGLIRAEAAPTDETLARVGTLSRWLLAERAPISAPDKRWDRLLYGIRNVEVALHGSR